VPSEPQSNPPKPPLLEVTKLKVHFPVTRGVIRQRLVGHVKAVDGVSLQIQRGETLGLVGESGCGKSTLGRAILRLHPATAGRIVFDGTDITTLDEPTLRPIRRRLQIIFQDPYASLNPRMPVRDIIAEPLVEHRLRPRGPALFARVAELMAQTGLDPSLAHRYPPEFSGGQRQRIGIPRALATEPELVVCDEPVSALDVSVQAQVINLLSDLQQQLGLTYLFIAHDLAAVRHLSDRIAVMYLGRLVEEGPADAITRDPQHPYTRALVSAVKLPDPKAERARRRIILPGDVPSPMSPPPGCPFHPRCPQAEARCQSEVPMLHATDTGGRIACHLPPR